jgi:Flp pilus assembly protein TadD
VLGYRYLQQGNVVEAERLLRTATAMDASHGMLWAYLSEVLLEKSDYLQALTAAKKATELEPQNSNYYHLIAVVYQRMGDEKSAMAMRSKAGVFENQEG